MENTTARSRHRFWFILFLTLGAIGLIEFVTSLLFGRALSGGTANMMGGTQGVIVWCARQILSPLMGMDTAFIVLFPFLLFLTHPIFILVWFGIAWYEYRQMLADRTLLDQKPR